MRSLNTFFSEQVKSSLVAVALLFVVGCQTMPYQPYARAVKSKPQEGGVVALKLEHRDEDTAMAQQMMTRNCGHAAVKVLEEGEVVVGQETSTSGNTAHNAGTSDKKVGSLFGLPLVAAGSAPNDSTKSVSATSAIKEWQISYTCIADSVDNRSSKKTRQ